MPHFKSIAEFEAQTGEDSPTAAETKLIAACRADEVCVISNTRPVFEPKGTTIRADLLRLLITGGGTDGNLPDSGVWLQGGWITGRLDLNFATAHGMTTLSACAT